MIHPVKKVIILCLVYLSPLLSNGQQFTYTATLNLVDSSGFYSILISPELSAHVKTDFADIRIRNEKKQWVPHILQSGRESLKADKFTPFPILQNSITDSGKNILIVENTKAEGIYSLKIFLKNAAVSRTATLSGSNNKLDWYTIDDEIAIERSYEMLKDEYLQEINFPFATYRFLKIVIDNAQNDPLLITKAGFYAQSNSNKASIYLENPSPMFTQKDSGSYSYIMVKQNSNYHFDKVSLELSGAKFYKREVQICLPAFGNDNVIKPGIVIGNFIVMSALPAKFELPRTKALIFFIVIKNLDNPPLTIEKIFLQQQAVSLTTYLEQHKKYILLVGDSATSLPHYDLQSFKDSIVLLGSLNYGQITPTDKLTKNATTTQHRWIWPVIILAAIMLSFLTYRLTADISRTKK